jgi:hypothetical protein
MATRNIDSRARPGTQFVASNARKGFLDIRSVLDSLYRAADKQDLKNRAKLPPL